MKFVETLNVIPLFYVTRTVERVISYLYTAEGLCDVARFIRELDVLVFWFLQMLWYFRSIYGYYCQKTYIKYIAGGMRSDT